MNLEQAVESLGALSIYFPRATLPEPTILAWASELREFESCDVLAGITKLGRELRRFEPTLADVIEQSREARSQRRERERQEAIAQLPRIAPGPPKPRSPAVKREALARIHEVLGSVGRAMPEVADERS